MSQTSEVAPPAQLIQRRRGKWAWFGISLLIASVTFLIVIEVMIERAGPILKGRVIETLSTQFKSKVELEEFSVSVLRGLEISGGRLRIFPPDAVMAAGATQPLIAIDHFSFHSGFMGLIFKPMHVRAVYATGLRINIPPREYRDRAPKGVESRRGKIKIVVDQIVCEKSQLIIGTAKPDKDPKDFELKHIELHTSDRMRPGITRQFSPMPFPVVIFAHLAASGPGILTVLATPLSPASTPLIMPI